jgi:multicomponent Na+:H+ antiporter subunit E
MRMLGRVTMLVALWLLAWGEITLANVLSGTVVAAALLVTFPPGRRTHGVLGVSLVGVARLIAYVAVQLVISNVVMTRQILRRTPDLHPGVLAHRLRQPSEEVATVMTSVIALSPGTMTVDLDRDSSTIYVHFFRLSDVDAARASLARLERLVVSAIAASDPDDNPVGTQPKEPR